MKFKIYCTEIRNAGFEQVCESFEGLAFYRESDTAGAKKSVSI